jgi:DNA processing protein
LGGDLAREGIGVASGLARGIDREAHEGCVAAGGYSIAVLGNGIDLLYPSSSAPLARALLKGGGVVVSEYPPGTPPLRFHFPARNRIISGLSRSVVVVQAPARSGALITAEYALEQGRDMYVHSAGLAGSAGDGTRRLAESGAPVIGSCEDIMRDWGRTPRGIEQNVARSDLQNVARSDLQNVARSDRVNGVCTLEGAAAHGRG